MENKPINQPLTLVYHKDFWLPILLTTLICAVIFGAVGYYLGQKSLVANQSISYQQNLSTPTVASSSIASDQTANWETYHNLEFSFKHPKDLKSDTDAAGTGFESIRFQFIGPKQVASGQTQTSLLDGYSFVVTKISLLSEKTPSQWISERRNNTKNSCGSEAVLSDIKQITVDQATGFQYSVKNCMGDYTGSYISYGENVYEVTQLYVGEPADQKIYEEITNQMLNSLKFL